MNARIDDLGVVWERVGWMRDGLCMQTDPDAHYPEKGESTTAAKAVCEGCPVRAECLAYAVARNERFGVWGGLSERERRPLVKAHRAAAADAAGEGGQPTRRTSTRDASAVAAAAADRRAA